MRPKGLSFGWLKAGLIGDPVSHSRSPRLFRALGARYDAVRVPAARFSRDVAALAARGYRGVNVTIPHKLAAFRFSKKATPEARAVGAANVLRFGPRGAVAHNTDAAGFLDELRELGFSPRGKDAVIFGRGGAAKAVGFALRRASARRVRVWTRDSKGAPPQAALWVNATPLGMKGFPDETPFSGPARCALAVDLVYGRKTAFMRAAEKVGARAADGSAMLVYQALRSLEFWTGKRFSAARRRALKQKLFKEIA